MDILFQCLETVKEHEEQQTSTKPWKDGVALGFGASDSRTITSLVMDSVALLPKHNPMCNL